MQFHSQLALHVLQPVPFGIDLKLGYTLADDDLGTARSVDIPDAAPWLVRHDDRRMPDGFVPTLVDEVVAKGIPGLSLAGCRELTAAGFAHLERSHGLRVLDLFNSSADDRAMAAVAQLEELESLNLAGTSITSAGLEHLAALPNLSRLDLGWTRIGDDALEVLARFPSLRAITLQHTEVSDAGIATIARARLEALCLQATRVGDRAVAALRPLARTLRRLHLGYTAVTDACVPDLLALDQLHTLMLRATAVTPAAITSLSRGIRGLAPTITSAPDVRGLIL